MESEHDSQTFIKRTGHQRVKSFDAPTSQFFQESVQLFNILKTNQVT